MNKVQSLIIILFLLAGLSMAGCSQQQAATDEASGATNGPGQTTMPLSTQLALGTLKLEGTETAVTAEQAVELLPLWKAAKTLSEADNVTSQELEAVFAQIQESMTGQQLSAIDEMDLSPQNMADLAQELGIEMPNRFGNLSPEMQSTLEAARASGQPPEGFTPGGGPGGGPPGGFDGGGGFAPPGGQAASGTQTPRQGNGNAAGAIFYQAVIDMLEKKVQ